MRSEARDTQHLHIGSIFATSLGTRISTNNLLNRHMLPALNRCQHCCLNNSKKHLKQEHKYERDQRMPIWHGWHAARRGLGTNLYRLGVPDKVIQAILRQSNVNVTLGYYIKPQTQDVVAAIGKFEAEIAAHEFGDTKSDIGCNARIRKLIFSKRLGWSRRFQT